MNSRFNHRWMAVIMVTAVLATAASCYSGKGMSYSTSPAATPRELDSADLRPGATFEHRFAAAGAYGYHCIHHSPMTGTVTVNPAAADTLAHVSITSSVMSFPGASVRPGGRVVWTNNSGDVHTVTSN